MKIIVIGLDGASFELIDPWIEAGELPNFKKLKEMGVHGDLISCLPPVTAPNWKCYSTGKNPGKLGIFWWENIDRVNRHIGFPRDRTRASRELVDIIGEKGKVVSINMPTTYPPKKVNGVLVSGPPDTSEEGFYYPEEIRQKLDKLQYKTTPENTALFRSKSRAKQRQAVEEVKEITRARFDFTRQIIEEEKPIFVHLTLFYINVLHHFFWDDRFTREAWQLIDEKVGEFLNSFASEYTFFFMSDHGSNRITRVFNINTWLEKKGYLVTSAGKARLLNNLGINRDNLGRVLATLGSGKLKNLIKTAMSGRILSQIPTKEGIFERDKKTGVIDWQKSRVVASGQGPIYILPDGKNRDEIVEKLIRELESLKDEGIIRAIFRKEEIYSGSHLGEAPDLILDQGKGIHIKGDIGRKEIFEEPDIWRGENKRLGLFMAYGPDIKRGEPVKNVSILDLAPTILHLMDIPIPVEMDGRVVKEIFREGSGLAQRGVEYQQIDTEGERIKEKIRKLKGLGGL
jgi:predicted AlkP superfamily phosphohydrolase/phosphomutase